MNKIKIVDGMFAHSKSVSSPYIGPAYFEWSREDYSNNELIIFTDDSLSLVDNFPNNKCWAWLLESPEITPSAYSYIKENHHKFDRVLTYKKELLELGDKFLFTPVGGCWIDSTNQSLHIKIKKISMIASHKIQTYGHRLRHQIISNPIIGPQIEAFGTGYKRIEHKIEALAEYKYSIVVENCQTDGYFTEKIIDCFRTGTIPIYWGCSNIGKFFDMRGIITFDTIEDLENIIQHLAEYYVSSESLVNNYERAVEYICAEDYIYANYLKNERER